MVAHFRSRERKRLQKKGKESVKKEKAKDGVPGKMGLRGGRSWGPDREPREKNQVTDMGRKPGFGVPAQTDRVEFA